MVNSDQASDVFLYPPWKHQKTSGFFMFSGVRKRPVALNGIMGYILSIRKWHEKCQGNLFVIILNCDDI